MTSYSFLVFRQVAAIFGLSRIVLQRINLALFRRNNLKDLEGRSLTSELVEYGWFECKTKIYD